MALSERLYKIDRRGQSKTHDLSTRPLWHGYLLTQEEKHQIDQLMGRALVDRKFCHRLLNERDVTVFADYGLTDATRQWLCSIEAGSLAEFAQAIIGNVGSISEYNH